MTDKTNVKIGIVGDQQRLVLSGSVVIADKLKKAFQCFLEFRSTGDHFIGNSRKLDNILGNGSLGIHKGVKTIQHFPVFDLHGTNLGDLAVQYRKTGGLNVKDHTFGCKIGIKLSRNRSGGVVDKIAFQSVDHLERIVVARHLFQRQHSVWIGLYVSVIGDGNGWMSPFHSGLNCRSGGDQRVHCRHGGMQMQLHTLFGCLVLAGKLGDLGDIGKEEGEIKVCLALSRQLLGVSAHGNHGTRFQQSAHLIGKLGFHTKGTVLNGGVAVKDVKADVKFIS